MKVAILGGAFNPPHLGHLLVAKQMLEFTKSKQVWLMPCFRHTFQKQLVDSSHRLKMVYCLVNKNIKCSELEIKHRLSGDTIDTMGFLSRLYPQHDFVFVIGSDNLPYFKKWGRWEKLILKYQFFVFPRPGFKYSLKKYGLDNPKYKFKLIKNSLLAKSDISSTLIRKRLEAGLSIDYLLPEKVKSYIKKNSLYQ